MITDESLNFHLYMVYSINFFVKVEENSGIILAGLVSVSLTLR